MTRNVARAPSGNMSSKQRADAIIGVSGGQGAGSAHVQTGGWNLRLRRRVRAPPAGLPADWNRQDQRQCRAAIRIVRAGSSARLRGHDRVVMRPSGTWGRHQIR